MKIFVSDKNQVNDWIDKSDIASLCHKSTHILPCKNNSKHHLEGFKMIELFYQIYLKDNRTYQ